MAKSKTVKVGAKVKYKAGKGGSSFGEGTVRGLEGERVTIETKAGKTIGRKLANVTPA